LESKSITFKVVSVGMLGTLLLVASTLVSCQVSARQGSWERIQDGLTKTWGGAQDVSGPVVLVPVTRDGKKAGTAWFLPEELSVEGATTTELLKHGICKTSVYAASLALKGRFPAALGAALAQGLQPDWGQARVAFGVSDLHGVRGAPVLELNGKKLALEPGAGDEGFKGGAMAAGLDGDPSGGTFSLTLDLRGSRRLRFVPVGKTTTVTLASPWSTPEFIGPFFPDSRDAGASGFRAAWRIGQINRGIPQHWVGAPRDLSSDTFGVDFAVPVDYYRSTQRAAQYSAMFIFLTFAVFFFVEFFVGKPLHPVQYLLVGAGVVLHYLLLLSLAEHLAFPLAYLLAAGAIVAVVASYTQWIFHLKRATAAVAGLLSGLYGFFYTLLQMEEYSLLMGSLGLLLALAVVMYLTRNFDWAAMEKPA
jgi:inner membrane protein